MENQPKKAWWRDAMVVFMRTSVWIALPLILALFIGKALDSHFGTRPWLFLGSIGFAFFVSCIGIVKTMKREVKKMEKENQNGNN